MADKSDVENALVSLIGAILYPSGPTGQPITGYHSRIYRGFPNSGALDADLLNGVAHITVFEQAGYSRLTGGYLDDDITARGTPTIFATVNGETVTVSGTPAVGQLIGVIVNGWEYAYACIAGDTPSTVATALAGVVNSGGVGGTISDYDALGITDYNGASLLTPGSASVSGAVITFAATRPIIARTACSGTSQARPRWQVQGFRIRIDAADPQGRDALAGYLDAILSATRFISLPDGQGARLEWRNTFSNDYTQKEQNFRRDLMFTVQFATSITIAAPSVLFPNANVTGSQNNPAAHS